MKFIGAHIFDYDATFRGDVTIEGNLTISNSVSQTISFGDNDKLKFGDGNDLEIYHDGSNSYIDAVDGSPGYLYIRNTKTDGDINFVSDDGSGGESTYFYLDGSQATHNGSFTTATYTIWGDRSHIAIGGAKDMQLYHDGSNSYIQQIDGATGDLIIEQGVNDGDIIFKSDDGSGGTTEYFRLDGGNEGSYFSKHVHLIDSVQLRIGNGNDAAFYHDSYDTYLTNDTGDFYIQNTANDKDVIFRCDDGSGGNATYFYLDGSLGGGDGAGTVFTIFPDNARAGFGANADLRIYHDGSHSKLLNLTGDIIIQNNTDDGDITFATDDGSGSAATYFRLDGSVASHDGSAFTALYTSWVDKSRIALGNSRDMQLYHDGTSSYIQNQTGNLTFRNFADDTDIIFETDDGSGGYTPYLTLDGSAETVEIAKNTNVNGNVTATRVISNIIRDGNENGHLVTTVTNASNTATVVGNTATCNTLTLGVKSSGTVTTAGNLTVSGDLTVSGTTTTIDTTNLNVEDKNITLNYSSGDSSSTADGAGITIQDAVDSSTDATILWDATNDEFDFSHSINISGNIKANTHYIGNTSNYLDVATGLRLRSDSNGIRLMPNGTDAGYIKHTGIDLVQPLTVGVDDTGHDVKFFGATASHYMLWDESKDLLQVAGDLEIKNANGSNPADAGSLVFNESGTTWASDMYGFRINLEGSANELKIQSANTSTVKEILKFARDTATSTFSGPVTVGEDDTGHDVIFYGATSGRYLQWDESDDSLKFRDNVKAKFGNGNDLALHHSGSQSEIKNLTGNLIIENTADDADIIFKTDDGSGGTTTYLTLDGGFSTPQVRVPDNVTFSIGNSQDLRLEHNGSNSVITQSGTGNLIIRQTVDDADLILQCDDGSGGETAYITLDGSNAFTQIHKDFYFLDSVKSYFGSDGDSYIRHTGSNFDIVNSTGNIAITNNTDNGDIIFSSDDGSGGTTEYFKLDGSAGSGSTVHTVFPDNSKAVFGAGLDTQIWHDGTNSYIKQQGGGNLIIQQTAADQDIILQSDDGSGGETEYFRLDGGGSLTIFSKHAQFVDNATLILGNSSDLQIYHDGTDSKIHNDTGHLKIEIDADDKDLQVWADDQSGGLAEYFRVDGSLGVNRFIRNVKHNDNVKASFGDALDLNLYHDGTNSYIHNDVGNLYIENDTTDGDVVFRSDDGSGGVTEYFRLDGGNVNVVASKNFQFLDDVKVKLGSSTDMELFHNGSNSFIDNYTGDMYIRQNADDKDLIFQCDDGSGGGETYFYLDGSANTDGNPRTKFPDNSRLMFGAGDDMDIFHNGTNSFIRNNSTSGDLIIQQGGADKDIILKCDDGSGGETAYITLDGSATTVEVAKATNFASTLTVNSSGSIYNSANFTVNGDIYSSGNIEVGTSSTYVGKMFNSAGKLTFQSDGDRDIQVGSSNNANVITIDTSALLTTFSGPVTVGEDDTGHDVKFFGATSGRYMMWDESADSLEFTDSAIITLGSSSDLRLYHDGSHSYIAKNGTGNLYIMQQTNDKDISFQCDDGAGGDIEYFRTDGSLATHDGSANTARYTLWGDNSVISLGNGNDLQIYHNATNSIITNATGDLYIENGADDKDILFRCDDGSGGLETYFYLDGSNNFSQSLKHIRFVVELPSKTIPVPTLPLPVSDS